MIEKGTPSSGTMTEVLGETAAKEFFRNVKSKEEHPT